MVESLSIRIAALEINSNFIAVYKGNKIIFIVFTKICFYFLGSIVIFAIFGTIISALVVGGGVYLMGLADLVYPLNFVESFAFGSLISAVDPVATLAIFQALDVDPVLNMLVFGESILNDAVAIGRYFMH